MSKSINIEGYIVSSTQVGVNEYKLSIFQNEKFVQNLPCRFNQIIRMKFHQHFN
jgi:hypothetical protein